MEWVEKAALEWLHIGAFGKTEALWNPSKIRVMKEPNSHMDEPSLYLQQIPQWKVEDAFFHPVDVTSHVVQCQRSAHDENYTAHHQKRMTNN